MEIDTRFPIKLNAISDAPEPLRGALARSFPLADPARLLVHAPAFATEEEKSPETVLAVTSNGWLVASEAEDGSVEIEKSNFSDTLFLELKSILLLGQLRISFAAGGSAHSVVVKFETVGEDLYREAIDLILGGIDPALSAVTENDRNEASLVEAWPMKIRNEAQRFWPSGQRLLAAIHWPAILDESLRQLAPAGALLITERELVLFSEETSANSLSEAPSTGDAKEGIGEIMTFIPRVRLAEFHVSHQERFDVLALQICAAQGEERLEIIFRSEDEKAASKAMEQMLISRAPRT